MEQPDEERLGFPDYQPVVQENWSYIACAIKMPAIRAISAVVRSIEVTVTIVFPPIR
jgi:hypothetical protein